MAKMDTLENVRRRWTLDDVLDANELLDIKAEAEQRSMAAAKAR